MEQAADGVQNNPYLDQKMKRKRARNQRFGFSFLIWTTFSIYLISPLAQVKTSIFKGNQMFSNSEMISISGLSEETLIWTIDFELASTNLTLHPFIEEASVYIEWGRLVVDVQEIQIIGKICVTCTDEPNIESYHYLLSNGQTISTPFSFHELSLLQKIQSLYSIPLLDSEDTSNSLLISNLIEVSYEIRTHISSITKAVFTTDVIDDYTLYIYDNRVSSDDFSLTIDEELIATLFTSTNYEALIRYIIEDDIDPSFGLICGEQLDQTGVVCSTLEVIS